MFHLLDFVNLIRGTIVIELIYYKDKYFNRFSLISSLFFTNHFIHPFQIKILF